MLDVFLCRGFLDVSSVNNSQLLTLSYPSAYLGDKRTAFGQTLTFNFSLPGLSDALTNSSSLQLVKGYLEVVPFITRLAPSERLVIDLDISNTDEPQQEEVVTCARLLHGHVVSWARDW